ncbi:Uncharacterized protein TCM_045756 [Theobroma cacao]|uniref:Uncharacterized protein n=1 Tax=Theobroma cacao TaxID=3641 RepID=S1RTM0_THECC|nr:Uncharacterized protein TCM_045756 [Theobroma cacao]
MRNSQVDVLNPCSGFHYSKNVFSLQRETFGWLGKMSARIFATTRNSRVVGSKFALKFTTANFRCNENAFPLQRDSLCYACLA